MDTMNSVLSRINNPILVAGLSVAAYAAFPYVHDAFDDPQKVSLRTVQFANLLIYGLSLLAVSLPGRYDDIKIRGDGCGCKGDCGDGCGCKGNCGDGCDCQCSDNGCGDGCGCKGNCGDGCDCQCSDNGNDNNRRSSDDASQPLLSKGDQKTEERRMVELRQRTFVTPAPWAFAIWGVIFLGELVSVIASFVLNKDNAIEKLEPIIRKVSGPFVTAQTFQVLWTMSFRPKYKSYFAYVSAIDLAGIAYALASAHAAYANRPDDYGRMDYFLFFFPLSLHFAWTTAASLVDVNGTVAMNKSVTTKALAYIGHASVLIATTIGLVVTLVRQAPVYGGVIAWALAAIAFEVSKRVKDNSNRNNQRRSFIAGAKPQIILCQIGAALNFLVAIATVFGYTHGLFRSAEESTDQAIDQATDKASEAQEEAEAHSQNLTDEMLPMFKWFAA